MTQELAGLFAQQRRGPAFPCQTIYPALTTAKTIIHTAGEVVMPEPSSWVLGRPSALCLLVCWLWPGSQNSTWGAEVRAQAPPSRGPQRGNDKEGERGLSATLPSLRPQALFLAST